MQINLNRKYDFEWSKMIQAENEYGSFGCDHEYMDITYNMFHDQLGNYLLSFSLTFYLIISRYALIIF